MGTSPSRELLSDGGSQPGASSSAGVARVPPPYGVGLADQGLGTVSRIHSLGPDASSDVDPAEQAAIDRATWLEVLPWAHDRKKSTRDHELTEITRKPNKPPVMSYVRERLKLDHPSLLRSLPNKDRGSYGRVRARATQVLSEIRSARHGNVPIRNLGTKHQFIPQFEANQPPTREHIEWTQTAHPSAKVNDPKFSDARWKEQLFWQTTRLEGSHVGVVTTFDKTLSIGGGFSTAGNQPEQIYRHVFRALPTIKEAAFALGLTIIERGKTPNFVVVDLDAGVILEGLAAANYLQTDVVLLSFFVNVAQGIQPNAASQNPDPAMRAAQRQTLLDAQFSTFDRNTIARLPRRLRVWPMDGLMLAIHAIHARPGYFDAAFWAWHAERFGTTMSEPKNIASSLLKRLKSKNEAGYLANICTGKYAALLKDLRLHDFNP